MKWDGKLTESMVQCRLWRELIEHGFEAETQIVIRLRGRKMVADVAVLDGDDIIGLVEVKRKPPAWGNRTRTRQYGKYMETGLPWRYCEGIDDIKSTVEWARGLQ